MHFQATLLRMTTLSLINCIRRGRLIELKDLIALREVLNHSQTCERVINLELIFKHDLKNKKDNNCLYNNFPFKLYHISL